MTQTSHEPSLHDGHDNVRAQNLHSPEVITCRLMSLNASDLRRQRTVTR
jgi:hypothetical protein